MKKYGSLVPGTMQGKWGEAVSKGCVDTDRVVVQKCIFGEEDMACAPLHYPASLCAARFEDIALEFPEA